MWGVMRKRKWTQTGVEHFLDCPGGMINRVLYGDTRPGTKWVFKIAEHFRIDPEDFGREPTEAFVLTAATLPAPAEAPEASKAAS